MKMKTVIVLLAALLLSMSAGAKGKVDKDPDDILYGPWVTNVSEESFTVVRRTKGNTLAWLEYAPDDGSNFPIVANSNVERLDFRADSDKITLSIYDESGKLTRSLEVVR